MESLNANNIMLALATDEILGAGIVLTRGGSRGRKPCTGPAPIVIAIPSSSYANAEIVFCGGNWTLQSSSSALLLKQHTAFMNALKVLEEIGVLGARELADAPMPYNDPGDPIGFP